MIIGPFPIDKDSGLHVIPLAPPYATPIYKGQRVALRLSEADYLLVSRAGRYAGAPIGVLVDVDTGIPYEATRIACSLPRCFCDAEIVEITAPS